MSLPLLELPCIEAKAGNVSREKEEQVYTGKLSMPPRGDRLRTVLAAGEAERRRRASKPTGVLPLMPLVPLVPSVAPPPAQPERYDPYAGAPNDGHRRIPRPWQRVEEDRGGVKRTFERTPRGDVLRETSVPVGAQKATATFSGSTPGLERLDLLAVGLTDKGLLVVSIDEDEGWYAEVQWTGQPIADPADDDYTDGDTVGAKQTVEAFNELSVQLFQAIRDAGLVATDEPLNMASVMSTSDGRIRCTVYRRWSFDFGSKQRLEVELVTSANGVPIVKVTEYPLFAPDATTPQATYIFGREPGSRRMMLFYTEYFYAEYFYNPPPGRIGNFFGYGQDGTMFEYTPDVKDPSNTAARSTSDPSHWLPFHSPDLNGKYSNPVPGTFPLDVDRLRIETLTTAEELLDIVSSRPGATRLFTGIQPLLEPFDYVVDTLREAWEYWYFLVRATIAVVADTLGLPPTPVELVLGAITLGAIAESKVREWRQAPVTRQLWRDAWANFYVARLGDEAHWPLARRVECSSDSNAILFADDPPWEKATGPQDLEARRKRLEFVQLDDGYCVQPADVLEVVKSARDSSQFNTLDLHPLTRARYTDVEKMLLCFLHALTPKGAQFNGSLYMPGAALPVNGATVASTSMTPPQGGWPSIVAMANSLHYARSWYREHTGRRLDPPTDEEMPFDTRVMGLLSTAEQRTRDFQRDQELVQRAERRTEVDRRSAWLAKRALPGIPPFLSTDADGLRLVQTVFASNNYSVDPVALFAVDRLGAQTSDYFARRDAFRAAECTVGDRPEPHTVVLGGLLDGQAPLAIGANEALLFHGSSLGNLMLILRDGFDSSHSRSFVRFGRGVYFADSSNKSAQYTQSAVRADDLVRLGLADRRDGAELRAMLICRVAVGCAAQVDGDATFDANRTTDGEQLFEVQGGTRLRRPYDSVFYDGERYDGQRYGGYREYIVYDDVRALPTHLLVFKEQ